MSLHSQHVRKPFKWSPHCLLTLLLCCLVSLMLDEIGITPSMGTEAISKILTKSLGACPPLPQLIRNSTEDKQEPSNLTGPQKRKKDLSKLVGTIIYNKKKGEEQKVHSNDKKIIIFLRGHSIYRLNNSLFYLSFSSTVYGTILWISERLSSCLQSHRKRCTVGTPLLLLPPRIHPTKQILPELDRGILERS